MSEAGSPKSTHLSLLKIAKPVYGGDFLAHSAGSDERGKTIMVPLVLPGEVVKAGIVEEKRSFARGESSEIVSPAASRVTPPCRHYGVCGGCHYQHADYAAQTAMKLQILRETLQRAGLAWEGEIDLLCAAETSQAWGYRNRIRVALTGAGEVGYRARRSHAVTAVEECPIAAPVLIEAARMAAAYLQAWPPPVRVTEMELFVDPAESQLLVTLFVELAWVPVELVSAQLWLDGLRESLPVTDAGVRLQLANGALVPTVVAERGQQWMQYEVAGHTYQVGNGAFFQINRWLLTAFVELVDPVLGRCAAEAQGGEAWDLFAGVGLFARRLAQRFERVFAVEAAAASWDGLNSNLAGSEAVAVASTTLEFLRRNREQRQPRPDLIVMDPPRAGLGEEVTTLLNAIHAPRMVYVSCDPATLVRDLKALTAERFRIERITMADMFPQTFHIETVVRLVRI